MSIRTVNLVATRDRLALDFQDSEKVRGGGLGIMSADYQINPAACNSKLGAWLAERIYTTRFDDDASRCSLLVDATEAGLHFREFGERLMREQNVRTREDAEAVFADMEQFVIRQRVMYDMYGKSAFAYRTFPYEWPVYGSARAEGAETPEQYFDLCAGRIRGLGAVILRAGLDDAAPPESLTATMMGGHGMDLLKRYRASLAA